MPRQHTSFRLSEPAMRKLAKLAEVYGNRTSTLEIAIDRMYQERNPAMSIQQDLRQIRVAVQEQEHKLREVGRPHEATLDDETMQELNDALHDLSHAYARIGNLEYMRWPES